MDSPGSFALASSSNPIRVLTLETEDLFTEHKGKGMMENTLEGAKTWVPKVAFHKYDLLGERAGSPGVARAETQDLGHPGQ
ncbi:hypothetical protein MATL_G00146840 [Megalops atlanticus]|uniref:Uncharacterized protein n=1 Tax=Megalops atlanticus TaxID=7932 RepID=A0A9D3PS00_MEGAT|nr:hypothetical protein MATL_G00146840 [Megalops atlanticus]